MGARLKSLAQQIIVITGASSGHGLATARRAAKAGATVVLVARDEEALTQVRDEISATGGKADYVVADVCEEAEVNRVAQETVARFGGFDTWVNNAGTGIYAELLDTPTEDHKRLFDTNYWGVVYGSLAAVRHFREKPDGGALINVGSVNSDMASPLLGAYNATKHAVKGFTDSLRIEMLREGAPVSVTLIKPAAIGTPFPQHGRNLTGLKGRLPAPIYSPELVADAICFAAQHPRRAITVGGVGRFQVMGATLMPSVFDRIASKMAPLLLDKGTPIPFEDGNLYAPSPDGPHARGEQKGRRFSLYTAAKTNPGVPATVLVLGGLVLAAWFLRKPVRAAAALATVGVAGSLTKARGGSIRRFARDAKEGLTDPKVFAAHARTRMQRMGFLSSV